ncbi:hypothetical protein DFP72DRAFT_1172400 [Ephemerocybe angulata]|uniref:F-box domain-containing protein n=1 Tax=Ephemerocybe angulata TaxID=980116 RepID=A0A8H6HQI2_9AGAR|nr:hypothetical protein DFP72DRAFT_1172400 [Tulosesus angulatus]
MDLPNDVALATTLDRQGTDPPISRLPPELLSRILVLAKENIVSCLLVSHLWREVSLQCPELWNTIEISSDTWGEVPRWFQGLLIKQACGRLVSLDVRFVSDGSDREVEDEETDDEGLDEEFLDSIVELITDVRIQVLTIQGLEGNKTGPEFLNMLPAASISELEVLNIWVKRLPLTLFSGAPTPRLRHLTLEHYNKPLPDAYLSYMGTLTHLQLTCITLDWKKVYVLLEEVKSTLEFLRISNSLPNRPASKDLDEPPPFIALDKIRNIELIECLPQVHHLLKSIRIPSAASLFTQGYDTDTPAKDLRDVFSACPASRSTFILEPNYIKMSVGDQEEFGPGGLFADFQVGNSGQGFVEENPWLHVIFDMGPQNFVVWDMEAFLLELFPAHKQWGLPNMCLSNLVSFHIEDVDLIHDDGENPLRPRYSLPLAFWKTLGQLPMLTDLRISAFSFHQFAQCLEEDSIARYISGNTLNPLSSSLFSSLERLDLEGHCFDPDGCGIVNATHRHPYKPCENFRTPYFIFIRNIRLRRGCGRPLKSLELRRCTGILPEHLDELALNIQRLVWVPHGLSSIPSMEYEQGSVVQSRRHRSN